MDAVKKNMASLVTTYLEMRSRDQLRPKRQADENFHVRELTERNWISNRDFYFRVGEQWAWIDKRSWSEKQWKQYVGDACLRTFAGYYYDKVAGYFELRRNSIQDQKSEAGPSFDQEEIEIAYFGLLPDFIGRGLGGALLTSAIESAWMWAPTPSRVWVHTCNRDHPHALANYEARGFRIYRVERMHRAAEDRGRRREGSRPAWPPLQRKQRAEDS